MLFYQAKQKLFLHSFLICATVKCCNCQYHCQNSVSQSHLWVDSLQNVAVRDVPHSALVGNIVYRMVQRGSGVFISAVDVAEATRVLVSVAERCFLSQDLMYWCGFHTSSVGPCMRMNMPETCVISNDERVSDKITFIALNPLSHSAVLTGIVLKHFSKALNFRVICWYTAFAGTLQHHHSC